MKYLFIILLFVYSSSYSQGFTFNTSSASFVGSATFTIASRTYTGGNTYVVFVATSVSSGTPTDNPSVSSGTLTLTKQGTISGTKCRIICYTFTPASNTTTAITLTYAESQAAQFYAIYTGSSLGTFTTVSVSTAGNTSADPSITMPIATTSHTIGYFFNNKNPFGGTAESGWAEDFDNGIATPWGQAGYHRNTTTDNTIQVTAASSTWIGLGIQYTQAQRRIFNVN